MNKYQKNGIYETTVDGTGKYVFENVQVNQYVIVLVSKETSDQGWFDNEDSYYASISNQLTSYLSQANANNFAKSVSFNKYTMQKIKVSKNQSTTFSYDFGITYI